MINFFTRFTTFDKFLTRNPESTKFGYLTRFTERTKKTEWTTFGFISEPYSRKTVFGSLSEPVL